MITISGLRRRGVTANVLRTWLITLHHQYPSMTDMAVLDHAIEKNLTIACGAWLFCARSKVVLTNYPEGQVEELEAIITRRSKFRKAKVHQP